MRRELLAQQHPGAELIIGFGIRAAAKALGTNDRLAGKSGIGRIRGKRKRRVRERGGKGAGDIRAHHDGAIAFRIWESIGEEGKDRSVRTGDRVARGDGDERPAPRLREANLALRRGGWLAGQPILKRVAGVEMVAVGGRGRGGAVWRKDAFVNAGGGERE